MSPVARYVVETVVTLLAIIALAVLVLYAARRVGVGKPGGPLSLVGRLPLDGRRAIYLIRVGKKVFVVGGSEAGLNKLGELDDQGLDLDAVTSSPAPFSDVLARVLSKKPAESDASNADEAPAESAEAEVEGRSG
ncbi:MAG: flagellar biosynthetic protein FliO [Polyangiaceae bacterium]